MHYSLGHTLIYAEDLVLIRLQLEMYVYLVCGRVVLSIVYACLSDDTLLLSKSEISTSAYSQPLTRTEITLG